MYLRKKNIRYEKYNVNDVKFRDRKVLNVFIINIT